MMKTVTAAHVIILHLKIFVFFKEWSAVMTPNFINDTINYDCILMLYFMTGIPPHYNNSIYAFIKIARKKYNYSPEKQFIDFIGWVEAQSVFDVL